MNLSDKLENDFIFDDESEVTIPEEIELEETTSDVEVLNEAESNPCTCYVIGGNLNLRKEPSPKSEIIKVLPLGMVLRSDVRFQEENGWIRVTDGSDEGWVMKEFVKFEEVIGR